MISVEALIVITALIIISALLSGLVIDIGAATTQIYTVVGINKTYSVSNLGANKTWMGWWVEHH